VPFQTVVPEKVAFREPLLTVISNSDGQRAGIEWIDWIDWYNSARAHGETGDFPRSTSTRPNGPRPALLQQS
jgi:hypothetical protein